MKSEVPCAAAEILLLPGKVDEVRLVMTAADTNRVNVVEEHTSVLLFMRRVGNYRSSPRPDLILLDLDLSNADHCGTLRDLKQDPEFQTIPVVVLTSAYSPAAMQKAYELSANACVKKPPDSEEFVRVIRGTLNFWLKVARLPKDEHR